MPVPNPPGSMRITFTPNCATSIRSASDSALEALLAGAVPAGQRRGHAAGDGGDVDDAAVAALAHARQHELGDARGREQVDLELVARVLRADVLDRARPGRSRRC